jgi:hypothetical protein
MVTRQRVGLPAIGWMMFAAADVEEPRNRAAKVIQ